MSITLSEIREMLRDLDPAVIAALTAALAVPSFLEGVPIYYTASGTFTKAGFPGLRAVRVEMVGGGGGSGGCAATAAGQASIGGSGGGAAYAESLVLAANLDTSEAVTVGAAGAAGAAGADGGDGGDSIFDTISGEVRAKAGGGGSLGLAVTVPGAGGVGGAGGASGTSAGDLVQGGIAGGTGNAYGLNRLLLGASGQSRWGFGQAMASTNSSGTGSGGTGYGAGGRGARNAQSDTAKAGANGTAGLVIVTPLY